VGREEASQLGLGGKAGGASGPTWLGRGKGGEGTRCGPRCCVAGPVRELGPRGRGREAGRLAPICELGQERGRLAQREKEKGFPIYG